MDLKIDKQNGNVAFSEDSHVYWDTTSDKRYISVTTLIEKFGQPFDKEFWSKYKALERVVDKNIWKDMRKSILETHKITSVLLNSYGIDEDEVNSAQQDILDEWEQNNKDACERGTKIHLDLENSMYAGGKNLKLDKFNIGGTFECRKGYNTLDLENGVYPEYLISWTSKDGIIRLAGQIDLLIKQGNNIIIGDYKTNKEIKTKGGFDTQTKQTVKMKFPLNNLEECNYSHYEMQLSTYAWMMQQLNPDYKITLLRLIHFDHSGNQTLYDLTYRKDEVVKMLKYYKKQVMKEEANARINPIQY